MEIDDGQLFEFMSDMRQTTGETLSEIRNLKDHVNAVSGKADAIRAELAIHSRDNEAHGIGPASKSSGDIRAWLAFFLSLTSVGLAFAFKK